MDKTNLFAGLLIALFVGVPVLTQMYLKVKFRQLDEEAAELESLEAEQRKDAKAAERNSRTAKVADATPEFAGLPPGNVDEYLAEAREVSLRNNAEPEFGPTQFEPS